MSFRIILFYSFQSPLILGETYSDYYRLVLTETNKERIIRDFQRDKNRRVNKTHLSCSSQTERAWRGEVGMLTRDWALAGYHDER